MSSIDFFVTPKYFFNNVVSDKVYFTLQTNKTRICCVGRISRYFISRGVETKQVSSNIFQCKLWPYNMLLREKYLVRKK